MYCSEMYLGHALLWLRYIDDVLVLLQGSIDTFLEQFMAELNGNKYMSNV